MEDLDAETGVEPVNDGFADRSLNRLGTPRFAYDEDATPNRGMGIVPFKPLVDSKGSPLPYGVSYDPCFRLDLNQRPLPCEGSALTNCATEAMTKPCDLIWVIECIIHSPELPHLDLNQDEQIQSLSCLPSYIMGQ